MRQSLLNPPHPGSFHPSLDNLCAPITTFHLAEKPQLGANHFVSHIDSVKANIINQLQSLANTNECERTKFECFSALLWKIIAKTTCSSNKKISKLGIVVDGDIEKNKGNGFLITLETCYPFLMVATK